jgi:hypothetical protein
MTGIQDLPRLAVVPVENLILHEYHDHQRTPPLMDKLRVSGVLINPPIVSPFGDQEGHYMVLDGANRTFAFKELGIHHILVQILEVDDPNMDLNAWNHIIWGVSPETLCSQLRKIPGVNFRTSVQAQTFLELKDIHALASLHLPDGNAFTLLTPSFDLDSRVRMMNKVVTSYSEFAHIDRTSLYQINSLNDKYENLAGLIILPPFDVTDVMEVVGAGNLMPPGSTRFTIVPRVLHVNYPLEELERDTSIEEKNKILEKFLFILLENKRVRYYAEPTYIFDE